jgi:CheY-like chemotaxis protein
MLIDLRGVSVLLVDDNEDILELSRRVLEERGAAVVTVNSVVGRSRN